MKQILSVQGLCKTYPGFQLGPLAFTLRPGVITGFIGRNGAGKSTTLKCLLNLVHPDRGSVQFFGLDFPTQELAVKARLAFVSGAFDAYPHKNLSTITSVVSRFYPEWDGGVYRRCLKRFDLDDGKRPKELSAGMKVKYALALALSHHAELLLLDEPTSGLDPVSREELLDLFLELVREEGVTLLFSTHITSDLEKCADDILYLRRGQLAGGGSLQDFRSGFRLARFAAKPGAAQELIGLKQDKEGWSALVPAQSRPHPSAILAEATLDDIMVHMEREAEV